MKQQIKRSILIIGCATVAVGCAKVGFRQADDGSFDALGKKVLLSKQDVVVNERREVDILFVVDNSGSMAEEQANFSSKINGFMNVVKDLDWNIALTTTDITPETVAADGVKRNWGDGQFRPFDSDTGSQFVLKSSEMTSAEAQNRLASAVEVGIKGGGDERSINATYRAIERMADTIGSKSFFRPNARLIVIAISDENECSDGSCLPTAPKSNPSNLLALVQSKFASDKIFSFNSIIKAKADSSCTTAVEASVYEEMSRLTGGIVGSVCSTDYTSTLATLGNKVIELVNSVQLGCAPVDMDGDGKADVEMHMENGQVMTSGFNMGAGKITFDAPLPVGHHWLSYRCADPTSLRP